MSASLSDIETFAAIVAHGSLRAAAAALGVKPPAISYRLNRLEAAVGTSLLLRTTRSLELTEAGRRLYQASDPALHDIRTAIRAARDASETPRGTLRLALSHVAFRYALMNRLAAFRALYPEIELDLSFDDAVVDLAQGRFHAGIRIGNVLEQDMIAIRLTGPRKIVHFAAPSYLDAMGRPARPADLLGHDCIRFRFGTSRRFLEWKFRGETGPMTIDVAGPVIVSHTTALVDAARAGLGIAWAAEEMVREHIESGALEVILKGDAVEGEPFYLCYPKEYARLRILRALIDFLKRPERHQPVA